MAITLYGIKSCSTMQKARTWLQEHGVVYAFHEYKTAGITPSVLQRWAEQVVDELPDLDRADVTACLRFASRRLDHPVLAA